MAWRIHRARQYFARETIRLIVHALPSFVLDDLSLRVQLADIQCYEQKTHAIGLKPQCGLEVV